MVVVELLPEGVVDFFTGDGTLESLALVLLFFRDVFVVRIFDWHGFCLFLPDNWF